jgi:hypothetical protein
VEESPEEQLQKRIALMEEEEKKKEEAEKIKIEENNKKEAEVQKKLSGSFEGFGSNAGSLPKYQELFKSPTAKLPPLPKFQPTIQKETVIPQPPQFAKKPKVEFVSNPSPTLPLTGQGDKKTDEVDLNPSGSAVAEPSPLDKGDNTKMTYDKLFGNDDKT